MKLQVRSDQDLLAGVLFGALGLIAFISALDYPLGTARTMGPGYFPLALSALLIVLALTLVIRGLTISQPAVTFRTFRPLLLVLASVIAFSLLVESAGLVVAIVATVAIARLGGDRATIAEIVIVSAALVALSSGVFVFALGMNISLWPGF